MPKVTTKHVAAVGAAVLATSVGAYSAQARGGDPSGTSPTTPGKRGHGPGNGGPLGDRGQDTAALAKALGVSTDKLTAAIKAVRDDAGTPGTTLDKAKDGPAKELAAALGTDEATITKVLEAQRPAGGPGRGGPRGTTPPQPQGTTPPAPPKAPQGTTPGGGPRGDHGPGDHGPGGHGPHGGPGGFGGPGGGPGFGGPDNAALVTALAKATGKSEADVKAAFTKLQAAREAEHEAREAAFAKALASKLGLDADKVTKAIESVRPAKPTGPAPTTPKKTTP